MSGSLLGLLQNIRERAAEFRMAERRVVQDLQPELHSAVRTTVEQLARMRTVIEMQDISNNSRRNDAHLPC